MADVLSDDGSGCAAADPEADWVVVTDLPDMRDVALGDLALQAASGEVLTADTLQRIAPDDQSRVLLVAASFNSAI